jgi:hypothetical protein
LRKAGVAAGVVVKAVIEVGWLTTISIYRGYIGLVNMLGVN